MPASSITIIASGTVSRIELRCASRVPATAVARAASLRTRCSHPPQVVIAAPIAAKATISTTFDSRPSWCWRRGAPTVPSAVAKALGPMPPEALEKSTAAIRNKRSVSSLTTGRSRRSAPVATITASAARAYPREALRADRAACGFGGQTPLSASVDLAMVSLSVAATGFRSLSKGAADRPTGYYVG